MLVTSRRPTGWAGETEIQLGGLRDEEGAVLFRRNAPQRLEAAPLPAARALSARLDGHPLSLRLLGSAFNEAQISLADLVASMTYGSTSAV